MVIVKVRGYNGNGNWYREYDNGNALQSISKSTYSMLKESWLYLIYTSYFIVHVHIML